MFTPQLLEREVKPKVAMTGLMERVTLPPASAIGHIQTPVFLAAPPARSGKSERSEPKETPSPAKQVRGKTARKMIS